MLAFGWLALRADRWWPIAATASLALCVLVRVMGMVNPELSRFAMLSAILGFWILLYTLVLGGVLERRLAGERGGERRRPVVDAVAAPPIGRAGDITIYFIAGQIMAVTSFTVAWWKGGHAERLGAAVLVCDALLTTAIVRLPAPGVHRAAMIVQILTTLAILWLTFRFDRWWLLVASGGLILCGLVTVLELLNPALSLYAAISAQLGLWMLVYLSLLAGVGERWLAGEWPGGDIAVWSRRPRLPTS